MSTDIAVSDAQIPGALAKLATDADLPGVYRGREDFTYWLKSAALAVIESADLRAALTTTQGKQTLVRALQRAACTGLSLNPQEGKAALVAFNNKITYMPMKNGLIELAQQTGRVSLIECETVYEADGFSIKKTARGDEFEFSPARKARGAVDGYFAAVVLNDGRSFVKYMDADQVQAHAKKYAKGLDKDSSAWRTSFDGMAQKTVLKALLRACQISPAIETALALDDEAEQPAERDVTPEKGTSADDVAAALEAEPARDGAEVVAAVSDKPEEKPVKIGKPAGDKIPDDLF